LLSGIGPHPIILNIVQMELLLDQTGTHHAGAQRIHSDALGGVTSSERNGELDSRSLGHIVEPLALAFVLLPSESRNRAKIYDRTLAALDHRRQRVFTTPDHALDVHRKHAVELFLINPSDVLDVVYSGIVDEDIDPAERFDCSSRQVFGDFLT